MALLLLTRTTYWESPRCFWGDGDSAWLRERSRTATTPVSPKPSHARRCRWGECNRAYHGTKTLEMGAKQAPLALTRQPTRSRVSEAWQTPATYGSFPVRLLAGCRRSSTAVSAFASTRLAAGERLQ
jgi:hypothetical protein